MTDEALKILFLAINETKVYNINKCLKGDGLE